MKKRAIIGLFFIGILSAGMMGCTDFQTSDLEGTWHMYMFETNPGANASYYACGSFTVDESGNVTEGTYIPPLGPRISVVGGAVSLDPAGLLSGSIVAKGGITVTFTSGKLDADKNMLTFVTGVSKGDTDVAMDLGVAMKGGGSFSTSDLEGTWHMYMFETNPGANSSYHSHGFFTVDASGNVTEGSYLPPGADAGIPVAGGMVSLNSAGLLSGSIVAQGGITVSFTAGKLDADKNILAYVSMVPNLAMELGVAMKEGGSFSTGDLEGTWHVYMMETNSAFGTYWLYGSFTVDASGDVTSGTYNDPNGATVAVTDGWVLLDDDGLLSGSIVAGDHLEGTFSSGRLGADKNILTFIGTDTNGSMDLGVAVKAGLPQSSAGN